MADGELFAAMHDVGLAEFVAKGLDKKHRKALPPLDVAGMTAAKAKVRDEFGGKKIFELSEHLWVDVGLDASDAADRVV